MSIEMKVVRARNRSAWRHWLEKHHDSSRGIWLEFYKKHTGKPCVSYSEALEEALCFGWIDSIVKRVDDERYVQKFTPRTNPRKWSASNLQRVQRLIAGGMMTDAGLRVLAVPLDVAEAATNNEATPESTVVETQEPVPRFIESAITRNPKAARFWQTLAPGYRRRYLSWILGAKGEATRLRRLSEAVSLLEAGIKSLLK